MHTFVFLYVEYSGSESHEAVSANVGQGLSILPGTAETGMMSGQGWAFQGQGQVDRTQAFFLTNKLSIVLYARVTLYRN